MKRDIAYEFAIEIVMAEAAIFPVAYQQKRLVVTLVHRQPMAAVTHTVRRPFTRICRLIIAGLIELENARIAISVGNIDRPVRPRNSRGKPPLIWRMKPRFLRSGDLLHHGPVQLHLDEEPVLLRRPLLHRSVEK